MNSEIIIPWIGGFEESNPEFAYPNPNLTSLPLLDNMANIPMLQREMCAKWPEFSWQTKLKDETSRCYQMFAPEISRIGYTAHGRVYSIICPQQGAFIPNLINLNVEVTVTGQRGWVNETTKEIAAEMTVTGKIWFSPDNNHPEIKKLIHLLKDSRFPFSKANAIEVETSNIGNTSKIFAVRKGISNKFPNPPFAIHDDVAFTEANVEVQINNIKKTNNEIIDKFNESVLEIFNILSGNMLLNSNVLSWNIWFSKPETVRTSEWINHAERWRHSIDVNHSSPHGNGTPARYYDGKPFEKKKLHVIKKMKEMYEYLALKSEELNLNKEDLYAAIYQFEKELQEN